MPYYYVYPFGVDADDLTSIPTATAVDGSVSYQQGWTDPYEEDLQTNPDALPIPRGQMNQLFYQITQNIQQYQQNGVPAWIASSDNLGTPYAYGIYARVRYGNVVYENQVASNTATPGTDSTWLVISGSTNGTIAGMIIDWAGPVSPTNWHICDGSALSRTTYATLLANITQKQTGTLTNTNAVVTGLSSTSGMYAGMYVEGSNIPSGTTILSVDTSTQITLSNSATGSGSSLITFFYWGNGDGSTTFNIPNLQTYTTAGAGGSGMTFGAGVGQSGGAQTHTIAVNELPDHTHTPPSNYKLMVQNKSGQGFYGGDNPFDQIGNTGSISGWTSQSAMNIIQPTALVNKIIRLI